MSTADQPPQMPHSLGALLLQQVRRQGDQPLLTFYGGATGERTELSYATFDNWASKTANLLAEECGAAPGTHVALGVTAHWTGAAITAAAWKLGAVVVPGTDPDALIRVVNEDDPGALAEAAHLVVVGAGMGGRVTGEVTGLPYGDEVLAFGDDYDDPGVSLDDPALSAGGHTWSQAELLRKAWGAMGAGDRLLSTAPLDASGVALGLLAPIVAGASVVWCPGMSDAAAAGHAENERATLRLVGGAIERL